MINGDVFLFLLAVTYSSAQLLWFLTVLWDLPLEQRCVRRIVFASCTLVSALRVGHRDLLVWLPPLHSYMIFFADALPCFDPGQEVPRGLLRTYAVGLAVQAMLRDTAMAPYTVFVWVQNIDSIRRLALKPRGLVSELLRRWWRIVLAVCLYWFGCLIATTAATTAATSIATTTTAAAVA